MSTFEEIVGKTDEAAKAEELKLAKRKLVRLYGSAIDNLTTQILESQANNAKMLDAIRKNPTAGVDNFNVNTRISNLVRISELASMRAHLSQEYRELFGNEPPELA